jgi:preprotein translocase subunit SecD
MLDSLADYPRWVVVACVTIVLAAAIWVMMKLLKWTLWLLLFAVLIIGLGTAAWLVFR